MSDAPTLDARAADEDGLGKRERNKLDKQRRIVAAATTLFQEKGFDETTTAEVPEGFAGIVLKGREAGGRCGEADGLELLAAAADPSRVILDAGLDLDEKITITREDRDLIRLTGSRLEYGATLSRRELILLALMSSENRAATALGRTYPGGMDNFVAHMNRKARALGMRNSHFADPAGLKAENVSTASDLAIMITAAEAYPLITQSTTTTRMEVRPYARRGPLVYGNTNRLLKNENWDIALSKTGFIREAGRCLVMQAKIEGEEVSIVLLNSFGKLTPYGDSNRLRKWMLANS